MVSMYVMLGPWIVVIFYAIWKWGPDVREEAKTNVIGGVNK